MLCILAVLIIAQGSLLDIEQGLVERLQFTLQEKLSLLQDLELTTTIEYPPFKWRPHQLPTFPLSLKSEAHVNSTVISLDYFTFLPIRQYKQGDLQSVGHNTVLLACTAESAMLLSFDGAVIAQITPRARIMECRGSTNSRGEISLDMRVFVFTELSMLVYEVAIMVRSMDDQIAFSKFSLIKDLPLKTGARMARYDIITRRIVVGFDEVVQVFDMEGLLTYQLELAFKLQDIAAGREGLFAVSARELYIFNEGASKLCEELQLPASILSLVPDQDSIFYLLLDDNTIATVQHCKGKE